MQRSNRTKKTRGLINLFPTTTLSLFCLLTTAPSDAQSLATTQNSATQKTAAQDTAGQNKTSQGELPSNTEQAIAKEAYIYAFPMVMNYKTFFAYSIDRSSGEFKAPFNQICNMPRVYTPKDTTIVTPNSDTPYSTLCLDLRAEPIVLSVPEIEKGRYYSVQLIDLYTFNYGYIGTRATGNGGGNYLIAGPNWHGEKPPGIAKVIRCETDFSLAAYRTQLFNPQDMPNVEKIQAGYKVETLSSFLKQAAPAALPEPKFPIWNDDALKTATFPYLNFLLQFCPDVPQESALRAEFSKIGIAAGQPFELAPEKKKALELGMLEGFHEIEKAVPNLGSNVNGWHIAYSGFGNRESFKGDWLKRAVVAAAGIYGNDPVEALYPMTRVDKEGQTLDGSKNKYTITFKNDELPPVLAFWSLTMYDAKNQLLIENPINRYLINSPMLDHLKRNADGSLTLYIQKDSPGSERESNWLPAPDGEIYLVMRLYWPKGEALSGAWKPPAVRKVQ